MLTVPKGAKPAFPAEQRKDMNALEGIQRLVTHARALSGQGDTAGALSHAGEAYRRLEEVLDRHGWPKA